MSAGVNDAHWRYALRVYGREGVSPACLHLQDVHGVDVNILLVALYAGVEDRRVIGPAEIGTLDATAHNVRERLVLPLRTIRRFLKPMPFGPGSDDLRNEIKKSEILAEKFEQSLLAGVASGFRQDAGTDATDISWHVVQHFDQAACAQSHPETSKCIATIARAAGSGRDA